MIDLNAIKNLNLKLNIGKSGAKGKGGHGGSILIISEELKGDGQISAEGGKGTTGGRGGSIRIISKKSKLTGQITTEGGDSNG
jgi:hypothetical protein